MKIEIIRQDSLADMWASLTAAALPFITIGMLSNNNAVMIVSGVVGAVALIGLIVRMVSGSKAEELSSGTTEMIRVVKEILAIPYPMSLSAAIAMMAGVDASGLLWVSLAIAVMVIIGNHNWK